MAGRADDATGNHASAAMVPVPPSQGIVLVAHGDRAAAGADGAEAGGAEPAPGGHSRTVPDAPEQVRDWIRGPYRSAWGRFFKGVDVVLRAADPWFPRRSRRRAIDKAVAFVAERLNGEDGLGGIYPAIANSVMMFDTLGYAPRCAARRHRLGAVRKLLVVEPDHAYCQPCLSPVWDTSLAGHALAEADSNATVDLLQLAGATADHSVWPATGRCGAPDCPPAAGPFNTGTITTRTWTTLPWWECCCTAPGIRRTPRRLPAPATGSSECSRRARRFEWLGCVRAGEYASAPEPYSVRRPWRAARSADLGRYSALRVFPGADRDAGG